jgi:hypothetical protein
VYVGQRLTKGTFCTACRFVFCSDVLDHLWPASKLGAMVPLVTACIIGEMGCQKTPCSPQVESHAVQDFGSRVHLAQHTRPLAGCTDVYLSR